MSSNDPTVPGAPDDEVGQDRRAIHTLAGGRFIPWRSQGIYQHPQIRSLIAKHCEQLSSGLVDLFRAEVEREVKEQVSEVIVSEATVFSEQLRSKDEAILVAETRCENLREQLEISKKMCCQLQERVRELESTETELRTALNKGGLEAQRPGLLESRHLSVIYERRDNRMLCRLCVDGHSKDETLSVTSFKEDDTKPSILAWHIQHQHPREYDMLLDMEEEELREVAKEMSRVGD